jgi:GcrA cell cycle regulator
MRPPNPGEILWSEALVARLSELWLSGITGGEIGHRLGISRCAVMGKLRRLGLLGAGRRMPAQLLKTTEQVSRPQKRPHKRNKLPLPPPEPYQAPPPPPLPPIGSFDLLELRNGHCRWPSDGDGPRWTFCGAKQTHDSSYCAEHHAMAHARVSQRDYDRQAEQALGGKLFASRAGVME